MSRMRCGHAGSPPGEELVFATTSRHAGLQVATSREEAAVLAVRGAGAVPAPPLTRRYSPITPTTGKTPHPACPDIARRDRDGTCSTVIPMSANITHGYRHDIAAITASWMIESIVPVFLRG